MEWVISTIVFFLVIWLIYCIGYSIEHDDVIEIALDKKKILDILVCITIFIFGLVLISIFIGAGVWFIHFILFEG